MCAYYGDVTEYLRAASAKQSTATQKPTPKQQNEALRFGGVIRDRTITKDVGVMMADHGLLLNGVGDDEDVFVYTGGEQQVPRDVKRVRIAENIDTIAASTFEGCGQLIEVEGHNKIKKIEHSAFNRCPCLRRVTKMQGVVETGQFAFNGCRALSALEFDKLEIIGLHTFDGCEPLRSISMPSIRIVKPFAFDGCTELGCAAFGEKLERIDGSAFWGSALRRIVIPLKQGLIIGNNAFNNCENLSRVDTLVGGIHKTISSLHLEMWRNEMLEEIDRINVTLPNTPAIKKAGSIQRWITRVFGRMEHYKSEHQILLKEVMTLLEMALWKAKLLNEKKCDVNEVTNKVTIDTEAARKEHRVTCGANIVIKNVLPFLALK